MWSQPTGRGGQSPSLDRDVPEGVPEHGWAPSQLLPCVRGSCGARRLERFLITPSIAESSHSLAIKVSPAPKIFANYCCAPLLSCPFLSLCSFPVAFDSINQSLVPNLVIFQLPCYSLSALWEMKAWKCV